MTWPTLFEFSFIVVLLQLIVGVSGHEYNEKGWISASKFLTRSMNKDRRPCSDFYAYACGGALKSKGASSSAADDPEADLRKLLVQELKKGAGSGRPHARGPEQQQGQNSEPSYKKWLKNLREQCLRLKVMTEGEVLEAVIFALADMADSSLNETTSANISKDNMWYTAGQMKRVFMTAFALDAKVDWIMRNCTKKSILKLTYSFEPRSGVWDQQAIDEANTELLTLKNISSTANESIPGNEVTLTRFFEAELIGLIEQEYERNAKLSGVEEGRTMKLADVKKTYPAVDWDAYLIGLFEVKRFDQWKANDPEVLLVGDKYFDLIGPLMNKYGPIVIGHSAVWKVINQVNDLYLSKMSGLESNAGKPGDTTAKEVFCYQLMKEYAPSAVARVLLDGLKGSITEWRNDVDLVGANVLAAFRIFITGQDWLDSQGKMAIIRRINDIRVDSGIPTWLEIDEEVSRRTPRFRSELSILQNMIYAYETAFEEAFIPILNPAAAAFIEAPPRIRLGAEYSFGKIEMNLQQILPPLYDIHYPLAVKYGVLGWLIGNKLMQGFDEASLREILVAGGDWLKGERERKFHQRKGCLIRQYSGYCYRNPFGDAQKINNQNHRKCVRISGSKTLNENIGDIEGLKVAYMAYKFVTQTMGAEPPLPNLVRRTNDQIFFLSAAQLHCSAGDHLIRYKKGRKAFLTAGVPNSVRVEQSIRNFPVFAKAFRCTKGSKYVPFRTCSLWGRFVSPSQCDLEDVQGPL